MAFPAPAVLERWSLWKPFLQKLNQDNNIHKRRASLVLLTKVVAKSSDREAAFLAFQNIDNLKSEKHILITKAISWLLRCLIVNHRSEVEDYLSHNSDLLPKIAIREVKTKLTTGKKYNKSNGKKN